jgi:hypothetical protein
MPVLATTASEVEVTRAHRIARSPPDRTPRSRLMPTGLAHLASLRLLAR